ncbi:DUF2804 domain-containing protein [Sporosarcina sp. ANT_H38]|uniref:DUF2804 domain-containing protein n=1 Tax=Sporosarcina sp. ANT_H38 TaxID=2597358 RepID=UPI0011F2F4AD|nr:DUF2804 domain-containing protein [Sporosarcina sp. ANT_H38]KAA0955735.1 DUF2804 domain-containing protein [Sporosarcina sp. ANT_H38]
MQHAEREITEPVALCDDKGLLNPEAIGFARQPYIQSNLKNHFMRKKKWNYWCVYGEDLLFSATISHLDYAAVCFVYILNYETQRFYEKQITIPFGRNVKMPENVLDGVKFVNDNLTVQIIHIQGETHLSVTIPDFDNEVLHADFHIGHPVNDESLNVVIPRSRDIFQFTSKHHSLPTSGFVKIGDKRFDFNPDYSFAVLDYGRGIWPRKAEWNWAMASQRQGSQRIGLNFGGKWTDGTGMTENAVFVNGLMTKIHEDVLFTYDTKNFMLPWKIRTKFSNTVNITFTPFFERVSITNVRLVSTEVHQVVGYFNGTVRLHDGSILQIRNMLGSSEEHIAKW